MNRQPPLPWYLTHLPVKEDEEVQRSKMIDVDSVAASVKAAKEVTEHIAQTSTSSGDSKMEDKVIERVMSFLPQAQGMNNAELLMLAKDKGGGFGEGGQGMFFLLFLLLLLGKGGQGGLFGSGDAAAAGLTVADLQNINTQLTALASNQNAGFANVADRLCGVNSAIAGSQSAIMAQLCALGSQMQQCCCNIEREIERGTASTAALINASTNALQTQATQNQFANIQSFNDLKVQAAADKCEVLRAIGASEANIINKMNADRMADLAAENAALKLGISQSAQTANIVAQLSAVCKPGCTPK